MSKQNFYTRLLIMLAIIVSLAFISTQFTFRLDFTGDQRYTLSNATLNILNDLEQVVTVKAYFSKDLPPNIASVKTDFKDLLIEYERRSGGKIAYEFIDPSKSEEAEQEAMQAGIQPVMINVRDKDQVKQQKAYLGAKLIH
ncbi:MAG: GldG family protein, partial [Chitinophagales bacterium]